MNHCQEKSGPTEEKAESTSILKVDSWKMTHKSGDVERSFNSHGIKSKEKNHEMPVSVNQDSNGKRNRRRKDSESPVRPCPIRPESLKEAKKFKWEKPSFIIKITQRSQTRAPCYFSTKFFRKYFENNPPECKYKVWKEVVPC